MKKSLILSLSAAMVLSSCSTYTGSGAITGGSLGSILGSAIGGIAGGARGSDIGSIVGMAGGAIIGASTGAKADRRAKEDVHDHYEKVQRRKAREKRNQSEYDYYNQTDDYGRSGSVDGSGFDNTNSGDDRIYDFQGSDYTGIYISPSIHIESIAPGKGVRYTALVKADKKLKNGMARFALTVLQGQKSISKVTEFNIKTSK